MNNYKVAFIISHRYYRSYQSYIKYYVDNIKHYYNDSLIIIVDNNSKYICDIMEIFKDYNNVIILNNDTECKFEIGAYKVGINYILSNNLLENYNYFTFTQDNFILKNKYDFNHLILNNITACALNTFNKHKEEYYNPVTHDILTKINLQDRIDELTLCWCSSFILNNSKIIDFLNIVKDIIITQRWQSCCSERYLSGILYYLNNYRMISIDGDIETREILKYDCWTVDLINDPIPERYFVKKVQQKTEKTVDE
jgi:hypothetical protein